MIVWLNGTFGVGKTTTARLLVETLPEARIFDSETVGYMLRHVLHTVPVRDFQDWRPWRRLVVETASQILDYVGGTLIVPQSVLVEQYWQEIQEGFDKAGVPVRHVVLHADRDTLIQRIDADVIEAGARQWRIDHLADYERAIAWLSLAGEVVDTSQSPPEHVVERIRDAL